MRPATKKKLNVLIIENNNVDRRMLEGLLSKSPYGILKSRAVGSLVEAESVLADKKIDVALLDLNLPDSDGLATLRRLHRMSAKLPIVVNTGAYQDDLGLKAVTSGAQDYLIKGKYDSYGLSKALYYAVERKKAEMQLKRTYVRLKETQSQLIQIEKMKVVGGLASGVAHEVKNPLATIMYGVEFLTTKLDDKDPQIAMTLESLKEATRRATAIIKDLLDFASLSKLEKANQDINGILCRAVSLIQHQCAKQGISIITEYEPGLPTVKIDGNRIEQVFVDIMLNSIYAMPDGGKLMIHTHTGKISEEERLKIANGNEHLKKGDPVLIVDIDDTGPGIPAEHLSKIFDPFFTTRRGAGGVGLGLSIARTIMKNHDGTIKIDNLKAGGARARLVFKIQERRADK